jgi:alpha-D-xyloside xylohydrolase
MFIPCNFRSPRFERLFPLIAILVFVGGAFQPTAHGQLQGEAIDVSDDFQDLDSTFFMAERLAKFDAKSGQGTLQWNRYVRKPGLSFNKLDTHFSRGESSEFPGTEYDRDPELPFTISFMSPRTVRIRCSTRALETKADQSLMLVDDLPSDDSWKVEKTEGGVTYTSSAGQVRLKFNPWELAFYDNEGQQLTRTFALNDPRSFSVAIPFCHVRRATDLGRSCAASFHLAHDEMLFGCGESFTRLNKRGQKVVLYAQDGMGAQGQRMYKPIPFFLSNRGYGMFVHTSAPTTFDFGHGFDEANVIYTGDEMLDLFVFLGDPQEVVTEYASVTGRAPVPPLWSFGLWMSRITYKSEQEVREVAAKLREHQIPSDVIHIDTGWFETDWQCDFEFSPSRFKDPVGMIRDLREQGFQICLWQLPYFTSHNRLFAEAAKAGYFVANEGGQMPYEDGILDFSDPQAVDWYQEKLRGLLELGVGAIKVDFGEEAPLRGIYASGRSGYFEHNLYPLRYNRVAAEVSREVTGNDLIWARSAWAGSQRYPLHWGGDAENSDSAMAGTLRGGLSLGLCGFTYWAHDAGGFVGRPPQDLYGRWLAFAALTSHTRCHGAPPREPWLYSDQFVDQFRRTMEMRYRLLPYVYAQAKESSRRGHPLLRTLFFEFPDDPASWTIEDQYMLGHDLLVAPLFSSETSRGVYLPPGHWYDYQTNESYEGGGWHAIEAGDVPIVVLVRDHAIIPHAELAQSTDKLDWTNIELRVFTSADAAEGLVAMPSGPPTRLVLRRNAQRTFQLLQDPTRGAVTWKPVAAVK